MLIGIGGRFFYSFDTTANHFSHPHYHLASILHPAEREDFCFRIFDQSYPLEIAEDLLSYTLNSPTHSTEDWEGTKFVNFVNNGRCPPYRWGKEIDFSIKPQVGTSSQTGITQMRRTFDDVLSGHPGDPEYLEALIDLEAGELWTLDSAYHLINHEAGHALNLCDGGPTFIGDSTCGTLSFCGGVMHSYGCPPPLGSWPSEFERASVESQIPTSSGGGGPETNGKIG